MLCYFSFGRCLGTSTYLHSIVANMPVFSDVYDAFNQFLTLLCPSSLLEFCDVISVVLGMDLEHAFDLKYLPIIILKVIDLAGDG